MGRLAAVFPTPALAEVATPWLTIAQSCQTSSYTNLDYFADTATACDLSPANFDTGMKKPTLKITIWGIRAKYEASGVTKLNRCGRAEVTVPDLTRSWTAFAATAHGTTGKYCEVVAGPKEGLRGYCVTRMWMIDAKPFANAEVTVCAWFQHDGSGAWPLDKMLAAVRTAWRTYA